MLIFTDGFDHYDTFTLKWNATPGSRDTGTVRTGSGSCAVGLTGTKQVAAADEHATFTIGLALYAAAGRGLEIALLSDSLTTTHVTLKAAAGSAITVYRGTSSGTLLGTASYTLLASTWTYIELKVKLHDTTGTVDVQVNGASVLSLTGQDTKNGGTKSVLDGFSINYIGNTVLVDDLYLTNAAGSANTGFLGDIKIETLMPSGAGTTTQLTPSTGSNYQCVDEVPQNTSDYCGSATAGQYDTYAMGNLATAAGTVYGANVWGYVAKSDAGAKSGALVVRSGGTDYEQTSVALGTSYVYTNTMFESDPATSAAWSISGINALEAGFKAKS